MEAEIIRRNKIRASIYQKTYSLKKLVNELEDQIANLSISLRESPDNDLLKLIQFNIELIRTQEHLTMQSMMPLTMQSMVPFEAVRKSVVLCNSCCTLFLCGILLKKRSQFAIGEPVPKVDSKIIRRELSSAGKALDEAAKDLPLKPRQ